MDCKEAKKAIPYFFADELEGRKLREFVKHLQSCPDCMEETTMQYLATEGLVRLEEGTNFDLDGELQEKIALSMRRERFHRSFRYLLVGVEIISILIILFIFVYVFLI